MFVSTREVQPINLELEDVIVEGPRKIKVEKIQRNPIGCRGKVHVNGSYCYDNLVPLIIVDQAVSELPAAV